jgi:CBS domain-containing protein
MKCSEIMTKDPVCCLPGDGAVKAALLMKNENVGAIPVVAEQQSRSLVGIVTDRDLALKIVAEGRDPEKTKVEEVMTTGVLACRTTDDIETALEVMEEHQIRRIPVVDDNVQVIGIIAQADIATRLNEPEKTAEVVEEISRATTP